MLANVARGRRLRRSSALAERPGAKTVPAGLDRPAFTHVAIQVVDDEARSETTVVVTLPARLRSAFVRALEDRLDWVDHYARDEGWHSVEIGEKLALLQGIERQTNGSVGELKLNAEQLDALAWVVTERRREIDDDILVSTPGARDAAHTAVKDISDIVRDARSALERNHSFAEAA